ncbi:type II toxin-antitoxin system VapC family toxin [Reyranella sp. CPCC 100927]|uniref:type II toxin-antitoxin system VapC family toxin n=1 Tax=Reyranella sp. CPCC 100927 TaxID=2599616 RepID=UPI0011B7040C|nr:type II toxin-antitoxin system VapC family toxin [Reyranella sp. CPCC 100927]TWT11576.1 type II toxin-antitoxin system VapC family toxin [Reyranella sp. CPCC 100927]
MFIDASAVIASLTGEPEAEIVGAKIDAARTAFAVSPVSLLETVANLARILREDHDTAHARVQEFLRVLDARTVSITPEIGMTAIAAHARYGKGRGHKARLNLGDCFAYACAKQLRVPLLCVGDDFIHTDVKVA